MKNIIICILLILSLKALAQDLNYGLLVGTNAYDIEIDGPISAGTAYSEVNLGIFGEYILNETFGLKLYGIYNTTNERSGYDFDNDGRIFESIELKTLQFHLLGKFDVNQDYKKGFYLTGGIKLTSILDKKAKRDEELLDGFFNPTNLGILLGFGVDFSQHFSIELLADRNLTNTLDDENNTAKNYGIYINLLFDISPLISKN